ncbi:hypothetical protein [Scytonema sp. NUACC26]|uniref:hypothetical protein n=1 Tax=Scytonema sp. NUACC26 TaxID=3140176 RepID=UPI0038B344DE
MTVDSYTDQLISNSIYNNLNLDGIQALVLQKMAQKELVNPNALERNLQISAHPLGLQSLLTSQIDTHFTTQPFL